MPRRASAVAAALLALALPAPAAEHGAAPRARCAGRYADTLAGLRPEIREREASRGAAYVYCLRATAIYEHISYGRGGRIRRQYHQKTRHGTGFAFREHGGEWYLATNHHVLSFPEVTRTDAEVEGVPAGSRKVRDWVQIVSSEADADGLDAAPLSLVIADEPLDLAVLKTRRSLQVLPYRLGSSAELKVGDAVLVRGFPLGAFAAANTGKVIGVGQRDLERGWDHEDFAVDALLNLGSSGSPVLAVRCDTGALELVGVYHAGYRGAQGLNVVIAVDGLRGVLERLEVPARAAGAEPAPDRAAIRTGLARGPLLMPFGGRAVRVEREGEAVRFSVLDASFPLSTRVEATLVDRGGAAPRGASELTDALWDQLALVLRYRAAEETGDGARSQWVRARIGARVREREEEQEDLVAGLRAGVGELAASTDGETSPAPSRPGEGSGRPARADGGTAAERTP
jgi:serine protease Do